MSTTHPPDNKHLLTNLLSQAEQLILPKGFESSSSWRRAQQSIDIVGSRNLGQWQISLPRQDGTIGGDYCVTFVLESQQHTQESHILADCSCKGFEFDNLCCHVLYFWWQFCQHNLLVYDIETREYHQSPPQNLTLDDQQAQAQVQAETEEVSA